jgi:MFS family permease
MARIRLRSSRSPASRDGIEVPPFNKILFPDPIVGTLAAFVTYSAGFVAQPLGVLVLGHFGDRVGWKSMLLISPNVFLC